MRIVGVDLGGTVIKAGMVENGQLLNEGIQTHPTEADRGGEAVIGNVIGVVKTLVGDNAIDGLCVAVPAPISKDRKTIRESPNLSCLNGVAVADRVAEEFNCPGVIENDANVAALGEWQFGAGVGKTDLIVLTLGTGIGGGVIVANRLLRGPNNASAELGHILVKTDGRTCGCGRVGCLEAQVSIAGLIERAAKLRPDLKLNHDSAGRLLAEAAEKEAVGKELSVVEDKGALGLFNEMGMYLGRAIADFTNTFGPEMLILSGGLSNASRFFLPSLKQTFREECRFDILHDAVEVRVSTMGNEAAIKGAAAAFLEQTKSTGRVTVAIPTQQQPHTIEVREPKNGAFLTLQIGVTRIRGAIVLGTGELIEESRQTRLVSTVERGNLSREEIMRAAVGIAEKCIASFNGKIDAIVLLVPAGVDRRAGLIHKVPGLTALGGYTVEVELFAHLNAPVFLENDANAALLFDREFGSLRQKPNVLGIHLVSGLGGALIIDNRLMVGRDGHAVEVGHIPLYVERGEQCRCNQIGCIEHYASGSALEREIDALADEGKEIPVRDHNYMDVVYAAEDGNEHAIGLMDKFKKHLAQGMVGILNMFNPDVVLFTGALSRGFPLFVHEVKEQVANKCFADIGDGVEFCQTSDPHDGDLRSAPIIAAGIPIERQG